jgi:hypothetical protein
VRLPLDRARTILGLADDVSFIVFQAIMDGWTSKRILAPGGSGATTAFATVDRKGGSMTHERRANEDQWERLGPAEAIEARPLEHEEMGVEQVEEIEVDEDAELADQETPAGEEA